MLEVISTRVSLCTGCNRCVRECPMEMANVIYQDKFEYIKSIVDYDKCIACGRCIKACHHGARVYNDDTPRFFADLQKGMPISVMTAPSIKTNIPEYKRLFTYLKRLGANAFYDVSLGADICIWAHVRYMEATDRPPIITQPCPVVVNYCEIYRHDLLGRLSPIHSPMACTAIYMKERRGITGPIAALSPCVAKSVELNDTKLADYNVTFEKLLEYLNTNDVALPDEETDFDHGESGLGTLFPIPGSLKENIESVMGRKIHAVKSEGSGIYKMLDRYAQMPDAFLPDIYDVLSCTEGCGKGTASPKDGCFFETGKMMNEQRVAVVSDERIADYKKVYDEYDRTLDPASFTRLYRPIHTEIPEIDDKDIEKALLALGKRRTDKEHDDCGACGSDTCRDMARKIALNINIPANCIIKSKDDARAEHEGILLIQTQLDEARSKREAEEKVRQILDAVAKERELELMRFNLVVKTANVGLYDMPINPNDPLSPENAITWSDEFRHMLGFKNEKDFPNLLKMWSGRIHPDDVGKATKGAYDHIMDKTGTLPFNEEFRIMRKDGSYAYIRAAGSTIRDAEGNPLHAVGALVDMSELKKLVDAAEEANRAKSNFLSHISHEIRTPINAVLGTAEIQLQRKAHTPDTEESFGRIIDSSNLLLNIINDLLDLSKIEAGKLELTPTEYNVPGLIHDAMQLILLRYESKPIEFNLIFAEDTPMDMYGDELRIKQILNNVLSNAFKYTESGEVELAVSGETDAGGCALVLRVSDTGQGMTREELDRLFDEYTRFHTGGRQTIVGTGLGMHITKRFLDMMGGEITVNSVPGKGTEFVIRIPQERVGSETCGPDMADRLRSSRFQGMLKVRNAKIAHEYMPYGNIMIVDDVDSNLYVAKGLMMPYGLKIETAASGYEAIDKVKEGNAYDIIFMDHMMPQMDGMEATQILRGMGYNHPIVALTANATTGQAEVFMKNGFDGFISKPIDMRDLDAVLNRLVRDKQPPEVVAAVRGKMGYQNTHNSAEFMKTVIQDLEKTLATMEGFMPAIETAGEEELRLFTTSVHGIKGALSYIGETELSTAAFWLEEAGAKGKTAEIKAEAPAFMDALRRLTKKNKTSATKGDGEMTPKEEAFLHEKLDEIKKACAHIKKSAAKKALDELTHTLWPRAVSVLLDEITVHLLHGEFKKVIHAADRLLSL